MHKIKTNLILAAALTALLWGLSGPTPSLGAAHRLSQVIYITRSKACGCSAKSVQAAVPYIGEYRLIRLPALIFLDAQHHLLWMAVGDVAQEDVAARLAQFGG